MAACQNVIDRKPSSNNSVFPKILICDFQVPETTCSLVKIPVPSQVLDPILLLIIYQWDHNVVSNCDSIYMAIWKIKWNNFHIHCFGISALVMCGQWRISLLLQEKLHKQWCLFDQVKAIMIVTEHFNFGTPGVLRHVFYAFLFIFIQRASWQAWWQMS